MKIILTAISFSFLLFMSSCSVSGNDSFISNSTVISNLSTGAYHVTYYSDNGTEATANFTGYSFTFGANNVLKAINSGTIISGGWVVIVENNAVNLQISFASPANFAKLSEDWKVIENTSSKTRLQNGNDYLTFEL